MYENLSALLLAGSEPEKNYETLLGDFQSKLFHILSSGKDQDFVRLNSFFADLIEFLKSLKIKQTQLSENIKTALGEQRKILINERDRLAEKTEELRKLIFSCGAALIELFISKDDSIKNIMPLFELLEFNSSSIQYFFEESQRIVGNKKIFLDDLISSLEPYSKTTCLYSNLPVMNLIPQGHLEEALEALKAITADVDSYDECLTLHETERLSTPRESFSPLTSAPGSIPSSIRSSRRSASESPVDPYEPNNVVRCLEAEFGDIDADDGNKQVLECLASLEEEIRLSMAGIYPRVYDLLPEDLKPKVFVVKDPAQQADYISHPLAKVFRYLRALDESALSENVQEKKRTLLLLIKAFHPQYLSVFSDSWTNTKQVPEGFFQVLELFDFESSVLENILHECVIHKCVSQLQQELINRDLGKKFLINIVGGDEKQINQSELNWCTKEFIEAQVNLMAAYLKESRSYNEDLQSLCESFWQKCVEKIENGSDSREVHTCRKLFIKLLYGKIISKEQTLVLEKDFNRQCKRELLLALFKPVISADEFCNLKEIVGASASDFLLFDIIQKVSPEDINKLALAHECFLGGVESEVQAAIVNVELCRKGYDSLCFSTVTQLTRAKKIDQPLLDQIAKAVNVLDISVPKAWFNMGVNPTQVVMPNLSGSLSVQMCDEDYRAYGPIDLCARREDVAQKCTMDVLDKTLQDVKALKTQINSFNFPRREAFVKKQALANLDKKGQVLLGALEDKILNQSEIDLKSKDLLVRNIHLASAGSKTISFDRRIPCDSKATALIKQLTEAHHQKYASINACLSRLDRLSSEALESVLQDIVSLANEIRGFSFSYWGDSSRICQQVILRKLDDSRCQVIEHIAQKKEAQLSNEAGKVSLEINSSQVPNEVGRAPVPEKNQLSEVKRRINEQLLPILVELNRLRNEAPALKREAIKAGVDFSGVEVGIRCLSTLSSIDLPAALIEIYADIEAVEAKIKGLDVAGIFKGKSRDVKTALLSKLSQLSTGIEDMRARAYLDSGAEMTTDRLFFALTKKQGSLSNNASQGPYVDDGLGRKGSVDSQGESIVSGSHSSTPSSPIPKSIGSVPSSPISFFGDTTRTYEEESFMSLVLGQA